MDQTSSWNRLFGVSAPEMPVFGASAFAAVSRQSRTTLTHRGSSLSTSGNAPTLQSVQAATQNTMELIFERVDLPTVCHSLAVIIEQHNAINGLKTQVLTEAPSDSGAQPSGASDPSATFSNVFVPCASAPVALLTDIGSGKVKKDSIVIVKSSLAEPDTTKTSQFGKLIRALPPYFRNITLQDCLMTEAAIASLTYGVLGSNYLVSLTLKHNTLGADRIKGIATGLVTNKVLETLELTYSDSIQFILPYLASSMDDNQTLNTIILNNDRLTDVSALTSSMRRASSSITALDLSSNYLDRSQASLVAEMLLVNPSLRSLNLSSNVFGDHGAQLIALALEQNIGLVSLKLDSCSLLDLGVSSLGRSLKFNNTLTHLSLAGNLVSDLSGAAFIESLESSRNLSLTELFLDGPTPHTLSRITDLLNRNIAIKQGTHDYLFPPTPPVSTSSALQLDSLDPFTSPREIAATTTVTLTQAQLTTLTDIRWNNYYPLTPKTMSDLFSFSAKIAHLNLSKCGIYQLPSSVKNLICLRVFDLRSNHLRLLPPTIVSCKSLEILKLSDNQLESLPAELSQLSSLQEVHLYGNPLSHIPNSRTHIDGILEGATLDTNLAGMNLYRYHHVRFQQSLLIQYLKTVYVAQTSDSEFNFGGVAVVGPEKAGKTSLLNAMASHLYKRVKTWESKCTTTVTEEFFELGDSASPKYRSTTPESPFDGDSSRCVTVGDMIYIPEDMAKKPVPYFHLTAHDFSGAAAYRDLWPFLLHGDQTLYLVVFSLVDYPKNMAPVEHYVNTLISRVGNASIMLIGTHKSARFSGKKNEAKDAVLQLKKQFGTKVVDVQFIDLTAKPDKLAKALIPIISAITIIGRTRLSWTQRFQSSYVKAIQQILHVRDDLDYPILPYSVFQEHMVSIGVIESNTELILNRLCAAGLVRAWRKDRKLKDLIFIDPAFLYHGLSELTGPQVAAKATNGTLLRKVLDGIWSQSTRAKVRPIFLKIAENFEFVSIDYTHIDERLTLPHLLSADSNVRSYWNGACPDGMKLVARQWDFGAFVPTGLGSKVIGACLALSQFDFSTMWHNGFVLRWGNEVAKLEYSPTEFWINLQVISEPSLKLFTFLNVIVSDTISGWVDSTPVRVVVPYPKPGSPNLVTKVLFSELSLMIVNHRTHYQVDGVAVAISDLAPDLFKSTEPNTAEITSKTEDRVLLGKGVFGFVFKAMQQGTPVIVKEAKLVADLVGGDLEQAESMMNALTTLSTRSSFPTQLMAVTHPNLVPFRGLTHQPHLAIYTSYVEGQRLSSFLKENPECDWLTKLKILVDVAFAIEHLHRQTPILVHGNLKPSNIFVSKSEGALIAKTSDWGLFPEISNYQGKSLAFHTSLSWMWQAPEVFVGGLMSAKSDSFSFGTLVWYMWMCHEQSKYTIDSVERTASLPFLVFASAFPRIPELQHAVFRRNLRPRLPNDNRMRPGTATLELLIRACWKPSPDERPDFSSIVKRLVQITDHVRDAANSASNTEPSKSGHSKVRSTYSVNMKQLQQQSREWQLLGSYVFKNQRYTFASVSHVPFKIPATFVSEVSKATSLVPAPESALSFLSSSTLWMGTARGVIVMLDLKDGTTSGEIPLEIPVEGRSHRPTITFVAATPSAVNRPATRESTKSRAPPPAMITATDAIPSSATASGPDPKSRATNQRIVGAFVTGLSIWSFTEDKTLTISKGPVVISKVTIGYHPICLTRSGDFGYVGTGEGILLELDLTREPQPQATSIDDYLLRRLDVMGHPVYSILVDDAHVWVGTKGEVFLLDRLSAHSKLSWVAHSDRVVSILKTPDGSHIWTASDDRDIHVWAIRPGTTPGSIELANTKPEKTLQHHTQRIKDMILVGNHIVSIAGENCAVWDIATGVVVKVLTHTGFANALTALDSNTLVTVSSKYDQQTSLNDNFIHIWHNRLASEQPV